MVFKMLYAKCYLLFLKFIKSIIGKANKDFYVWFK